MGGYTNLSKVLKHYHLWLRRGRGLGKWAHPPPTAPVMHVLIVSMEPYKMTREEDLINENLA